MNVQFQARHFMDGLVHLYQGSEFDDPHQHLVTPLHSGASWYTDDHERHKVGEPVAPVGDVELCESCVAVSFRMALGLPVVPSPRTRRRAPARPDTGRSRPGKRPTFVPSPRPRRRARAMPDTGWSRPLVAVAV